MSRPVTPKAAKLMQEGMQLMQAGAFLEAGRAFERAAQQMPDLADAHCFRADALMRAGRLDPALSSIDRAVRLRPDWGEAWMLRGNIEALLERPVDAERTFRRALQLIGAHPGVLFNLANVLADQGRFEDALAEYERALQLADGLDIHTKRALVLERLGRRAESETAWNEVLKRDPDSLEAMHHLLQIYSATRRIADVEAICTRALAKAPDAVEFRLNHGLALWTCDRFDEALAVIREAGRLAFEAGNKSVFHEASLNEAMGLLKLGRLREGWERYRWRLDRSALRERYQNLVEKPAEFAATARPCRIRIHMDQGIGDQLFFLRFAPALRTRGHELLLGTDRKLVPLLSGRRDLFAWVGPEDAPDAPKGDLDLMSSDLPLASAHEHANSLELNVDDRRREALAGLLRSFGPPPYVGVTWRAGLLPAELKNWRGAYWSKQVPAAQLGRVLRSVPATAVILQREPDPGAKAEFVEGLGRECLNLSAVNEDLQDALALLSLLDEYIGVSNTNMHLMAALPAKAARVLVLMPSEWRWGFREASSCWFPRFHLYRQSDDNSWDPALSRLAADLMGLYGRTWRS